MPAPAIEPARHSPGSRGVGRLDGGAPPDPPAGRDSGAWFNGDLPAWARGNTDQDGTDVVVGFW